MNYEEEFRETCFPLLELAAEIEIYSTFTSKGDKCLMNLLKDGAQCKNGCGVRCCWPRSGHNAM